MSTLTNPIYFNSILKLIDKSVKAELELKRLPDEFIINSFERKMMEKKRKQLESEVLQAQEKLRESIHQLP